MIKIKKSIIFVVLIFTIIVGITPNVCADENERIKGLADFLLDRASDNYLFIIEQKIKDNEALKLFLPSTYDQINNMSLKMVLVSSSSVWKESIEKDLKNLRKKYQEFLKPEIDAYISKKESEYNNDFLIRAQNTKIIIEGKEYPINYIPFDAPPEVKNKINNINVQYIEIRDKLISLFTQIGQIKGNNLGDISTVSEINSMLDELIRWESILKSPGYDLTGGGELLELSKQVEYYLEGIRDIIPHAKNMADNSLPMTIRVNSSLYVIEYIGKKHTGSIFINPEDYERFQKYFPQFKQYAMFFAQLSDAKSGAETKEILKAYTLPAVSFGSKRKPNERHFTVSSYVGGTLGIESRNREDQYNFEAGITAPIGIELSWGKKDRDSCSIFASILDFGPAINSQLYNKDEDLKIKDIIAPGLFIIHGFKNLPLAVGGGYQHSKGLRSKEPSEDHFLFFLALDMPLFILY